MTFGGHIRLAGAVVSIIGAVTNTVILSVVGLCIMAIGAAWQIDALERRVAELEPKEQTDEKA